MKTITLKTNNGIAIGKDRPDQDRSTNVICVLASCALALGLILGMSGLVLWPICLFEGWKGDPLITIMFVTSFVLLSLGWHFFDCDDERKRAERRRSL